MSAPAPVQVGTDQVRAFRLTRHNLTRRLPPDRLLDAAGACAVQNTPPHAAALALHARTDGLTPAALDRAVDQDKTLVQTWAMRGSPFLMPTTDLDAFTTGLLPDTEDELRAYLIGACADVDRLGMSLTEAVDRTEDKLPEILTGTEAAINELGRDLTQAIAPDLPSTQRTIWQAPGPHAADQPLGEAVVHFALRISTLRQTICMAPRRADKAPFILTTEWIDPPTPRADPDTARRENLRRYLRCYGPSTRAHYASWAGISTAQATRTWHLLDDELRSAGVDGTATWFLAADAAALQSPDDAHGIRLLLPSAPYTQQRDRRTLLPDIARQRQLWRTVGAPGALLVDGHIAGVWNARKEGKRLAVTVRAFQPLSTTRRAAVDDEAQTTAAICGTDTADVTFD